MFGFVCPEVRGIRAGFETTSIVTEAMEWRPKNTEMSYVGRRMNIKDIIYSHSE